MTTDVQIGIGLLLMVGVVGGIAFLFLRIAGDASRRLVYRRVVEETNQTILLECGHAYELKRHKRETFPCPECACARREAEDRK